MFCQSKEFDHVTGWLKHSLQAIVVYVKYFFMFQNNHKRLGHSVICSIDYWLLYANRKLKWYEVSESELVCGIRYELDIIHNMKISMTCVLAVFSHCAHAHMHALHDKSWNVSWNKSITMFVSHTLDTTKVWKVNISRKSKSIL